MAGYLCRAFVVDFRKKESPFERDQRLQHEKQLVANQNADDQQQYLQDKYRKERNSAIESYLSSLGQREKEETMTLFLESHIKQNWFRNLYEKKGFNNPTTQGVWFSFIASKFLPEKWHSLEAFEAASKKDN